MGHRITQVAFRNCTPFTKCTTKIDGTTIEDLDLVKSIYNLTVQVILKQQKVYGFILKTEQLILM